MYSGLTQARPELMHTRARDTGDTAPATAVAQILHEMHISYRPKIATTTDCNSLGTKLQSTTLKCVSQHDSDFSYQSYREKSEFY